MGGAVGGAASQPRPQPLEYGIVIGPSEDVLKVPFIQYKDPNTGVVSCPKGSFNRMFFSRGQGPRARGKGPGARGQGPGE